MTLSSTPKRLCVSCLLAGMALEPPTPTPTPNPQPPTPPPPIMSLNGTVLHWKDTVKHLGNFISNDLSQDEEIKYKQCDFIGRVNSVCPNFKSAPRDVVSKIFTAQCCHLYGCQAWTLNAKSIQQFNTAWKKAIRKLWGCPIWHAQHYCLCLCVQNPSLSKYINALPKCTMKYTKVLMVRCSCFWKQLQILEWWVWSGRIYIS